MDNWGLGSQIVGMPKSSKIDYLMEYNNNDAIVNLGTFKGSGYGGAHGGSEPDVIFIGGRLSASMTNCLKLLPSFYTAVDYEGGRDSECEKQRVHDCVHLRGGRKRRLRNWPESTPVWRRFVRRQRERPQ